MGDFTPNTVDSTFSDPEDTKLSTAIETEEGNEDEQMIDTAGDLDPEPAVETEEENKDEQTIDTAGDLDPDKQEQEIENQDANDGGMVQENLAPPLQPSGSFSVAQKDLAVQTIRLSKIYDKNKSESLLRGMDAASGFLKYLEAVESQISNKEDEEKPETEEKQAEVKEVKEEILSLSAQFYPVDQEFGLDGKLVGKNDKFLAHSNNKEPNTLIRAVYSWTDDIAKSPPKLSSTESPLPEQVNLISLSIFSKPIAKFFETELGFQAVDHDIVRIGIPFRPLLRNLQAMREHTEHLRLTFGPEDESSTSQTGQNHESQALAESSDESEDKAKKETDAYNCPEALRHFQPLLQFVDQYLSKEITLYQQLNSGLGEKVAFKDLWMLFDTGVTIYSASQEGGVKIEDIEEEDAFHVTKKRQLPQVYRVLATAGGIPLSKSLSSRYLEAQSEFRYGDSYMERAFIDPMNKIVRANTRMSSTQTTKNKYSPLHVMCFFLDYDGVKFGTGMEIFLFKPYDGEADINGLAAYPMGYYKSTPLQTPEKGSHQSTIDGSSSVDDFVERGRRFIDVTSVSHMSYDGLTVGGAAREQINSDVVVDFRTAFEEYRKEFRGSASDTPQFSSLTSFWPDTGEEEFYEYYSSCGDSIWCKHDCIRELYSDHQQMQLQKMESKVKTLIEECGYEKMQHPEDNEGLKELMEKHDLLRLLPGAVPGYALRHRKWVRLDLNVLEPVRQEDGWDRLVLPKGHRQMVQAMVEIHAKSSRSSMYSGESKIEMDLVRGKGKGCIILLHGAPGVGKTSTAECVASYTQRPLYPITCGDIGYIPENVEKNMEEHFKLARRWGCVLLLDEADVFLAKRLKSDVKRNGLVSVFLRILEYYTGILFLTTNRVGAIDDAFRSRLHLTLFYPKLEKKETVKIWKTNFKRLETNNEERQKNHQPIIVYDKKKILKWLDNNWEKMQWNGRQIRNAFQTAIALAEFNAAHPAEGSAPSAQTPTLNKNLFGLIANASIQFSEYLQLTHGMDEDTTASRDQVRLKSYEAKSTGIKMDHDSEESSSPSSGQESDSNHTDDSGNESSNTSQADSDLDESSKKSKKDKLRKKSNTSQASKDKKKEKKRKERKK
ncbi:hypothetical protein N7540_000154 [Penicillium herquei]|nr:hypothetical protein N7540_000154 [Penicillium herquei]